MNAIEIIKSRLPNGNKVQAELVYDQDATTPRECDNLGTILIAPNKAQWIANRDSAVDTSSLLVTALMSIGKTSAINSSILKNLILPSCTQLLSMNMVKYPYNWVIKVVGTIAW